MISVQDLLDAEIELYNPIIKVWDEDIKEYVAKVELDGEGWIKFRHLPIKYIYTTPRSLFKGHEPKVVIEVSINDQD